MKAKAKIVVKLKLSEYEMNLIEYALVAYAEKVSSVENERDCLLMAATLRKVV